MRLLALQAVVCLALAGVARADEASDKAQVKKLYEAATSHYNLGEFQEALDAYKEAYRIRADPVFLYNLGQCYRQLNKPADAAREYRAYLREQPEAKNRAAVEKLIKDMDEAVQQQRATQPPLGTEPPVTQQQPQTTTTTETTPAPSEPQPRKPDYIAIAMLVAGGLVLATGIGLVAWSATLDSSSRDITVKTDLATREDQLSQSGTVEVVGYAMIGTGAALAVASVIKFAVHPRRDVAVGFTGRGLVLGGTF